MAEERGARVFFYSDPHVDHARIIEYNKRPFFNVEQMNRGLIDNYNSLVRPGDEVYFHGDVGFCTSDRLARWLEQLNGKKYLIRGNHDKAACKEPASKHFEWTKDYHEMTYQDNRGAGRTGKNWFFVMLHYPILEWNRKHHSSIHTHGHSHSSKIVRDARLCKGCGLVVDPKVRRFDVGVDANNWFPVAIETIIDEALKIPIGNQKQYETPQTSTTLSGED